MPVTITQNNDGSMKITGKVSKNQKILQRNANRLVTIGDTWLFQRCIAHIRT